MVTRVEFLHRLKPVHLIKPMAFLTCGILISCLGLSDHGPGHLIAALLCLLWVCLGLYLEIKGALAILLLIAFNLQGLSTDIVLVPLIIGVSIILTAYYILVYPDLDVSHASDPSSHRLRQLRNELRDAEFQQEILQRHIGRYPILLNACTVFSRAQELGQLAKILGDESIKLLPYYQHVSVYFGKDDNIYCPHGHNNDGSPYNLDTHVIDDNIRYVIQESRLLVLRNNTIIHLYIPLRGDRRQELMYGAHGLNGVLYLSFQSRGIDDELLIDILRAFGRLGGLSLAAVNLMEQAQALALHDDLTGLFGKHEFHRRLDEQISFCKRTHKMLGLIMCDMDHLKLFNDEFGHPAGDEALKAIAASIQKSIPESAIACRFGGEEFSMFFVCDNSKQVSQLAYDICSCIRNTQLKVARNVSASIGWAILQQDEEASELFSRADNACYRAKSLGRDQVCEGSL